MGAHAVLIALAAGALPLVPARVGAAAEYVTDYAEREANFVSSSSGEDVTCVLSAFTVLREDGSASTSTGTSGDFSECTSDQRLTIRASWVDDRGDRHHHFVTTARFALNTRFEGVASDFVVTSEVTYRLCEPQTGCRYQVTTAPK